jgi:hypothetical protein
MAAFLIILLILVGLGANEAVRFYYVHCRHTELFDCLIGSLNDEEESEGTVAATGVYEYKGYSVSVTMNIPLDGGKVSGTVSGECSGSITGTFNGKSNGAVSGTMSGVCSPFFVNIPASAEFSGTVNKSSKSIPISFNGRGGGFSHQGTMTLVYP